MLTKEVRETMRENAYSLLETMILEDVPFRLVLWNNNNWDKPLPTSIMDAFPTQLVLDIKEMALDESYIDESTGETIITTMFEGVEYSKVIIYDEIIAILDLVGQPYILNNFEPDVVQADKVFQEKDISFSPKTKEDILELVISDGVPKEAASKSMEAFMNNNPDLALKLKEN